MVVQSGVYPYQYITSSWADSNTGKFRIPANSLVQPSAIHFEETMYTLKSEWNRLINKESGYRSNSSYSPSWWLTWNGRFPAFMNNGMSGLYDPNPSGSNLDGKLGVLDYTSNFTAVIGSNQPAAIHQRDYIKAGRELFDRIISYYSERGGGWPILGSLEEDESGVRRDWLEIYKGYNDLWSSSGLWFQGSSRFIEPDERFLSSGIIFDKHLDEIRIQPIPYFSINNGWAGGLTVQVNNSDVQFVAPYGFQSKQEGWNRWPLRPTYLMTNGSLPSGWASGLELCVNRNTLASGVGGHLIPGLQLAISGNGVWTTLSGNYISDMNNETRPDSPSSCRFTNIVPSGKSVIPSGQHRIMLINQGDQVSFPWGASGTPHRSAIWPFAGQYEPNDGILFSAINRYWDINPQNMSFWITDDVFCFRNNNGSTQGSSPHYNSGMYWLMRNNGNSHHTNLIDGWPIDSTPDSGMSVLYGSAKTLAVQLSASDAFSWIFGGGWAYDRSNNDYMVVGRSGLTGAGVSRSSGIYGRWNQQMLFQQGGAFAPLNAGGYRWHLSNAHNNAFNGTDWIINGAIASGLDDTPAVEVCWARVDTSYNLVDAIIGNTIGWVSYLRSKSEYLSLDRAVISTASELPGVSGAKYKVITPTWGTLSTIDAAGSGSFSSTEYQCTFNSNMSGIINVANETARNRIHLCKFFETEPDNDVYCTFMAFTAGANSGTTSRPDLWIGRLDAGSHPFEMTNAWMIMNLGTTYANVILSNGFSVAHGDAGSCDHMEIHVNG